MYLSKNFTLEELIKSPTAKRFKIDNTPGTKEAENLRNLCTKILQPIRDKYGKPITINSGYRCPRVNALIKGAKTSDHIYGAAADIQTLSDNKKDNKALFDLIESMVKKGEIVVRQLIDEFDYNWIHISYQCGRDTKKNQILHLK